MADLPEVLPFFLVLYQPLLLALLDKAGALLPVQNVNQHHCLADREAATEKAFPVEFLSKGKGFLAGLC